MNMQSSPPVLAIIVPCFNEVEVVSQTATELILQLNQLIEQQKIALKSFVCFIDDGSNDNTWQKITALCQTTQQITAIKLSRNFGHQNALYCGMMHCKDKADCILSIDADLQDDVTEIDKFIDYYQQGYQIIYGVRKTRTVDSFWKKTTAQSFYRFMKMLKVEIIPQHADFRLVSNKVAQHLANFSEFHLFLRGLFPLIGFKTATVTYDRQKRNAGMTKYPFSKMLAFAFDAITSFSVSPLRLITIFGCVVFTFSMFMSLYLLMKAEMLHAALPGWATTVLPIYFIGGIQLLSIGIIGEYVGKIYTQTKARPRYIIEAEIFHD